MENLTYHDVESLKKLSLEELQSLWDLVPTDRQKAYRAAYDREVRNAGAIGSDALEQQVARVLIKRYDENALVPVGSRWARTPQRVQEAARQQDVLPETDESEADSAGKPSPKIMLALAGFFVLALIFMLSRGGNSEFDSVAVAIAGTLTPTPEVSPTPTPLALEAQDDVITGGDAERQVAYPVNLQVILPDGDVPGVWVVQRREVRAAEWDFDGNPDVASFVNGMSVRPVIGIPWSQENARWFKSIADGAVFNVTINTGAILRYEFASKTQVRRSDTHLFRQVSPGLALLLIGETDENGLPTATRTLVTAVYPADQELSRMDEWLSLISDRLPEPAPIAQMQATVTPETTGNLHVQLINATTITGQLTTRLRIYNGGRDAVTFTPDDIQLALGYAANPPGPWQPAEGMAPFTLELEQAVDLTLVWAWEGEGFAGLSVREWVFDVKLSDR